MQKRIEEILPQRKCAVYPNQVTDILDLNTEKAPFDQFSIYILGENGNAAVSMRKTVHCSCCRCL
jgi:hypothetical protein